MDSEDGELFVKQLATFVRTHEKALANALQFKRQNIPRHGSSQSVSSVSTVPLASSPTVPERPSTSSSTSSTLAAALSLGTLSFTSHSVKSAKLALTPHHLFYLLSRFEELGIPVGPMTVRLENLHDSTTSANYVSFLGQSQRSKSRGSDAVSIRSVSSIRSVMSGMSALWASFGIGSSISAARTERHKAAIQADLKYLYSSFTKIPCLKLSPDWRARLIRGYEEFPFDSAVPLYVFKNVQALEVTDIDFRQFFGWDRLADQLRSLTIRRAGLDDPADVLIDIVLDDMDKRRRRSSKTQVSPTVPWGGSVSPKRSPTMPHIELRKSTSAPGSPDARKSTSDLPIGSLNSELDAYHDDDSARDGRRPSLPRGDSDEPSSPSKETRPRSHSPRRPTSSRNGSSNMRGSYKVRRSGSGSSHSSLSDSWHQRGSSSNLLSARILPASKWRFLRHLSLADNSLTSIPANSLSPLSNTLYSLDLSSNLFSQIPDSLSNLTALRALNLANCMIDSLHSLTRNPLPAITAINLRNNRLQSLAGIEKLYPLERLDLRDNRLTDPTELARLTGLPEIREIYVEGNPFARTHRDYRITIFNLFRRTPGYTEDITIDSTGPSYSEKKYLVDRVAEPLAVPVIKPQPQEMPAIDVSKPAIIYDAPREPAVLRKERPVPKTTNSEVNTSSTRRRRAPKRRIVDLATNENPIPHAQPIERYGSSDPSMPATSSGHYSISHSPETPKVGANILGESPLPNTQLPEIPRVDTSMIPPLSPIYSSRETQTIQNTWPSSQEWDVGGEMYRRKIEALRDKIGDNYLHVLAEESWDTSHPTAFVSSNPLHANSTTPRAATVQAIHSGRTLG
ncbi:leucine rich repeat domain-containing protein [Thozetella sp. PMI_491]|nr:leucine rich repeat domain-containing protein [Thozetella sp. PMI_491]